MILEKLGTLMVPGTPQALTAGSTDQSTNILDLLALGVAGFGPGGNKVFIDLEAATAATGDSADTFVFDLIVADSTNLDNGTQGTNYYKVLTVDILNYADPRISAIGKKIYTGEIPDQLWQLAKEGFRYCGWQMTMSAGAALSINNAFSPSRPRTEDNVQVTASPVALPS